MPFVGVFLRFDGGRRNLGGIINKYCRSMPDPFTFAPTFTKPTTRMIRKFAMLATVAALFVACSGNTAEDAAAKAAAAQDSAAKMMDQAAAAAKAATEAAAATTDSAASAVADTAKKAMDEATTK
jgi:hypothetical protein